MKNIVGIGTDLVRIPRITDIYSRFGQKFVKRILSEAEMPFFNQSSQPAHYLAKRFAAKEAIAKALHTGIGTVAFNEISVLNHASGEPYVTFHSDVFSRQREWENYHIMVSLSDEKEYALAFVIIKQ